MCEKVDRIDGKTVIVTGGNSGIGKETVRDLVSRGVYRNLNKPCSVIISMTVKQ